MRKIVTICFLSSIISGFSQLNSTNHQFIDNLPKMGNNVNNSNAKRSISNPTKCAVDTIEYGRYKGSAFNTITVSRGRSLGQLYSTPKPVVLTGFTFYAFVAANPPSRKKLNLICNVYKAGSDSLPRGMPLRSDTITIDSTFGNGLLSNIEKHATFAPITLDSAYILTVESDSANLNSGIVTNSYANGDGEGENLNCGSISGLWYSGRNLNIGGVRFDADILLHPHVKFSLGADFSIKNNCYNLSDTIKFLNTINSNMSGSRMYNRYLLYNLGYYCHWWDVGNFTGNTFSVDHKVKYSLKQNYKIRLISFIYGYRGNQNGCSDTAIKWLYFKPDMPKVIGPAKACIGDTATYTANSNDTGVVYEWLSSANSNVPFYTGKTYKKFPLTKTDTFYLRANNSGCLSPTRTIILAVNTYPSTFTVANDTICAGSKATLKGNSNIGSVEWFKDITGGVKVFTGAVYQTPNLLKDTFLYAQANNGGCLLTPRLKVIAIVKGNVAPVSPTKSNDTSVCLANTSSVALKASASSGLTIRWFSVGSGGIPITTGTSYNFTPTKRETKIIFVDAYNGQCGSTREQIIIEIEDYPRISKIQNDTICKGANLVDMLAQIPYGTAHWFTAATNGVEVIQGEQFIGFESATKTYYVETRSGICKSPTRTPITALVNTYPIITKLIGDTVCAKNRAILKGVTTGLGSLNWYDSDTSTKILGTNKNFTTDILLGGKKYFAEPTYAGCIGPRLSITPTVLAVPFSGFSFETKTWQQVKVSPINQGVTSLQWDFGDGFKSTFPNVTHRYVNVGNYKIKLTLTSLLNECIDSTIVFVDILPSSISEITLPSLNIFPNPSNSAIQVKGVVKLNEAVNFRIYSISGSVEQKGSILENEKINIENLASGMYFIHFNGYKPMMFVKI
ncbi:MAG: T9SS type A sorting domain-containing protein [Bacteroidetes bacterium]|nr:T9SS type A sorting domain-containing protein [Bacteroidota bacterium]